MKKELQDARTDYKTGSLDESDLKNNPIDQFKLWFEEYKNLEVADYNTMMLTTVGEDMGPSSRIVLLKGVHDDGFEFYTNYDSAKAKDIEHNNKVCLNFFWSELERQVRVEGVAKKMSAAESDEYFAMRPRGSQIGAWASPQSTVIEGRFELEKAVRYFENKFAGSIPRPEHWGGYRVYPEKVEFWQGRSNRLHDRLIYNKREKDWQVQRLAP